MIMINTIDPSIANDLIRVLGWFGFKHLPNGWSSFEKHSDNDWDGPNSYFPLVMFVLMGFFNSLGVVAVPWMLMSEVFPFK